MLTLDAAELIVRDAAATRDCLASLVEFGVVQPLPPIQLLLLRRATASTVQRAELAVNFRVAAATANE